MSIKYLGTIEKCSNNHNILAEVDVLHKLTIKMSKAPQLDTFILMTPLLRASKLFGFFPQTLRVSKA